MFKLGLCWFDLFTHGLFTLPDIYWQQKAETKDCVLNINEGFICSKGTITKFFVISVKVKEGGQMNAELWHVDIQGGRGHSEQ